ncbi:Arc family DNA-binding protein [Mesorhizobium sp. WSM4887]|uniref:Arc family DNA-binding protein n=1 Tax=Mesorhizobium sp. WSM4887 TaxID=3038543 RepID=UPI002415DBA2|nr:Arc family DNA-binding protein [Mesorhizobium sp. WSM4887]MDG4889274.1 Arc family DNA-binding protein [Mesorhizobium sp. WSM4887]
MAEDHETRITLRLPQKLHAELVASAEKFSRSMNGEIVFRLEEFGKMMREVERAEERASKLEWEIHSNERANERTFEKAFIEGMERLARIEEKLDAKFKK